MLVEPALAVVETVLEPRVFLLRLQQLLLDGARLGLCPLLFG
jgi:hypothetical protein